MSHKYTFLVSSLELDPSVADLTPEEIQHGFNQAMGGFGQSISTSIQQVPEGPWEAVSHSVTRLENHLVITVMLRGDT